MAVTIDGSASVTINSGVILGITSSTAVASTSGATIDFTSLPSWIKRITVMFNGVSLSGTSHLLVQLGAGSVETTSYKGQTIITNTASATLNSVAGFPIYGSEAAFNQNGNLIISTLGSNVWTASGSFAAIGGVTASVTVSGGSKTLSGTLDRVRITTVNGTDTFDLGSVNIMYEG
jgi:hypothetical protein